MIKPTGSEYLIDALPYFDKGYDEPGVRESCLALINEQLSRFKPASYLEPLKEYKFETELMTTEFERIESRMPMEILSTKRYQLPSPLPGKQNDMLSWIECLENSRAQLQHQYLRLMNLENINKYGSEVWKKFLATLESDVKLLNERLRNVRKMTQEINWDRKNNQSDIGDRLMALEEKWVSLVTHNYEIERSIVQLQTSVVEVEKTFKELQSEFENVSVMST
ncbi:hypothetical protein A3Q56_02200 [Intoshia linei]|uniref:Pre-mRNA-splicing factor SPF27 n=1 Tax=Intoshia linei TaxID=1819745 RepID=A0A177B9D7_9BILA|nr:hypothetical protein A3Q56_02200 [Intoshia linei]